MDVSVFTRLGFTVTTKLSEIEKWELTYFDLENASFLGEENLNVVEGLRGRIAYYNNLLASPSDEQPFLKRGFDYQAENGNPTIAEIVSELHPETPEYRQLKKTLTEIDAEGPTKDRLQRVTKVFILVAQGFAIGQFISKLEELYDVAVINEHYFSKMTMPKRINGMEDDLKRAELLNRCGFDIETTLVDYERQHKVIHTLRKAHENIKSPDPLTTIQDRIELFSEKVKKSGLGIVYESLHRKGFLHAVRGENPTLFTLLTDNFSYVRDAYFDILDRYRKEFGRDEVNNAKKIFQFMAEGYAYCYHISYLETEQKKVTTETPGALEPPNRFIKLKWLGQKNQLYDVLRGLKTKGLLGNSYEDMAVFLKNNVDIFHNTALSTIHKEIGKDKRPAKNKRIDLDL